jgi:hypothetical protein
MSVHQEWGEFADKYPTRLLYVESICTHHVSDMMTSNGRRILTCPYQLCAGSMPGYKFTLLSDPSFNTSEATKLVIFPVFTFGVPTEILFYHMPEASRK